ncbi:hypothetical protein R3P38DRAFT_320446 [Favolaschia claudopus]|uniref:Ricin B lectin domain-containing protein n=1 Tax=Favolaschia claudopus TaxID=2862362 RepID=A0AAW0CV04_9AGAR
MDRVVLIPPSSTMFSNWNLFSTIIVAVVAPAVTAQILQDQSVKIQTTLGSGTKCLAASSLQNGAPVVIEDCGSNATSLNSWITGGTGARSQLSTNGFVRCYALSYCHIICFLDAQSSVLQCLDVVNNVDANGSKLQVWTCGPRDEAQQFTMTSTSIEWNGGSNNKCVDVTDGNLSNGNQAQVWACDANNSNQKFNFIPTTFPARFELTIRPDPTTFASCLTADNATNAPVAIGPCGDNVPINQKIVDPDHNGRMVMYDNLCIAPAGDTLADGTKLVLAPCDANDNAQFWNHGTGSITNKANTNFCFDLTDGNPAAGTQVQIWTCFAELGL